ncbi:hypothetical protein ACHAWF_015269 [Thalassiosira exigua]
MSNGNEAAHPTPTILGEAAPSLRHDEAIPAATAAIPAAESAEPVERGRFVQHLHNRDDDSASEDDSGGGAVHDDIGRNRSRVPPDSPRSFDSNEIFEDVEQAEEQISDQDLERLLGPLPTSRRNATTGGSNANSRSLEIDDSGRDDVRRKRSHKTICPCCPNAVRRGPCHMLAALMGGDGSSPSLGNMIVLFPRCYPYGFGIVGPHWFGPVCCLGLLTIATIYFASKAYHNVGPISGITCMLFYIIAVVSLGLVSCSDPGVVKPRGGVDGRGGRNSYAGVPMMDVSASRGWRYCDLCRRTVACFFSEHFYLAVIFTSSYTPLPLTHKSSISVFQPPDAVHCAECGVCIEGYDHHCPWMGTCIGKRNFTAFMTFNVTWLLYLFYAIIWVTFVGKTFFGVMVDSSSDDS